MKTWDIGTKLSEDEEEVEITITYPPDKVIESEIEFVDHGYIIRVKKSHPSTIEEKNGNFVYKKEEKL